MKFMLVSASLLVAAGCPAPGEGAKAERGYKRAEPIIAALAQFHADSGHYPTSLAALVPAFLADSALAVPTKEQERYPWLYNRVADAYTLQFRYTGPGSNECTYLAATREWKCSGLY